MGEHSSIVKTHLALRVLLLFTVLFCSHTFIFIALSINTHISSLAATLLVALLVKVRVSSLAVVFVCCTTHHNSLHLPRYIYHRCGPGALAAFDCVSRVPYLKMHVYLKMGVNACMVPGRGWGVEAEHSLQHSISLQVRLAEMWARVAGGI